MTTVAIEVRLRVAVPLMTSLVSCGFPSPAEDHLDRALDFNELLVENLPATIVVRVDGDSMIDIGILSGDFAVVNRAVNAVDKCIVLAVVDGDFTIKRYRRRGNRLWLHPENAKYPDIEILEGMTFEVTGVVTGIVRKF